MDGHRRTHAHARQTEKERRGEERERDRQRDHLLVWVRTRDVPHRCMPSHRCLHTAAFTPLHAFTPLPSHRCLHTAAFTRETCHTAACPRCHMHHRQLFAVIAAAESAAPHNHGGSEVSAATGETDRALRKRDDKARGPTAR